MAVRTPEFRINWPKLFNPETNEGGKKVYSVDALFNSKSDLSKLRALADTTLAEKFPGKKITFESLEHNPFRDQKDRANKETGSLPDGYEAGSIWMRFKSYNRPPIVGPDPRVPVTDPAEMYSGCYGIAMVNAVAYDYKGKKGVSFWLQSLQKSRNGEPLTGRSRPEDDYEAIAGAGTTAEGTTASSLFG